MTAVFPETEVQEKEPLPFAPSHNTRAHTTTTVDAITCFWTHTSPSPVPLSSKNHQTKRGRVSGSHHHLAPPKECCGPTLHRPLRCPFVQPSLLSTVHLNVLLLRCLKFSTKKETENNVSFHVN